jgi:hypothetical protein
MVSTYLYAPVERMARLNQLRLHYKATIEALVFPFSVEEFRQLLERREAILAEAKELSRKLNI